MKRTIVGFEALLWILFGSFAVAATLPVILTAIYAPEYGILDVPFASWFVVGLSGLMLVLDGLAVYFWRRFRGKRRELAALTRQPLGEEVPAVHGHKCLAPPEFLAIVATLFGRPPEVKHVYVKPLPGGYGGSTTVLVELGHEDGGVRLPKSFVVKLGDRREMVDEHDKFQQYVHPRLTHAARFFRHAQWGRFAGIAYEFVGLGSDHEVQSLTQFYRGHAAVEIPALIGDVYSHLAQAWYRDGQRERADLYQEYDLLRRQRERIVGHIGEIVEEGDPYRVNFTAVEARLRPNLKPVFCSELDIPWYDPIVFLRTWPRSNLVGSVYRSVVHGDLNARNVLVEIGRDGRRRVWFIDFSHTGNGLSGDRTREASHDGVPVDPDRGHTLRDFCRLEADVKFILTRLQDEDDLGLAVAFERALMAGGLALDDLASIPLPTGALMDERFRKAWLAIREIRRWAVAYLTSPDDLRPYYLSLLHATLSTVYYHPDQFDDPACERQQKRYALVSAGMLCRQL